MPPNNSLLLEGIVLKMVFSLLLYGYVRDHHLRHQ